MSEEISESEAGIEIANLLLIVVGAHLRAEVADRPLAYQLCDSVDNWLEKQAGGLNVLVTPIVCSDVWYVNQESLQGRPTISIGGPGVNALSAYYANKLKSALVHDNHKVIQLDPEFVDLRASIWGMDHKLTVEALDLFVDRYLDDYLRAAATQVEPQDG